MNGLDQNEAVQTRRLLWRRGCYGSYVPYGLSCLLYLILGVIGSYLTSPAKLGYNGYMTKIYRSLINGAPFILAMALGLSFMDTHINYWKSAFIALALLNSVKHLLDYEYSNE